MEKSRLKYRYSILIAPRSIEIVPPARNRTSYR